MQQPEMRSRLAGVGHILGHAKLLGHLLYLIQHQIKGGQSEMGVFLFVFEDQVQGKLPASLTAKAQLPSHAFLRLLTQRKIG